MFLSIGFAALVSGVVGFYPLSSSIISKIYLDKISAMIFGISGIAAWNIGAKLIFYKKTRIKIQRLSFFLFFVFCIYILTLRICNSILQTLAEGNRLWDLGYFHGATCTYRKADDCGH
jgi:hypothetical protein